MHPAASIAPWQPCCRLRNVSYPLSVPALGSTGCEQCSRGLEERGQEECDTYSPTCLWAESWRLQNVENSALFSSQSDAVHREARGSHIPCTSSDVALGFCAGGVQEVGLGWPGLSSPPWNHRSCGCWVCPPRAFPAN